MKNISQLFTPLDKTLLCLLTFFMAYTFGRSCYVMLGGHKGIEAAYDEFGVKSQRETIAMLEGAGALLILWPRTAVLGASFLIIAMTGILAANVPSNGGVPGNPVLMLMLCIFLLVVHLSFHIHKHLTKTE